MESRNIFVFDPTAQKKKASKGIPGKAVDLKGKRLAVIWNGKLGGDVLLHRLAELLSARLGLAGIERIDARADSGSNLPESVIGRLVSASDVAILGTAD